MDELTSVTETEATADRVTLRLSRLCVALSFAAAIGTQKLAFPAFAEWFDCIWRMPRVVFILLRLDGAHIFWQLLIGYLVLVALFPKRLSPRRELALNVALVALFLAAICVMVLGMIACTIPGCVSRMGYQPLIP